MKITGHIPATYRILAVKALTGNYSVMSSLFSSLPRDARRPSLLVNNANVSFMVTAPGYAPDQ